MMEPGRLQAQELREGNYLPGAGPLYPWLFLVSPLATSHLPPLCWSECPLKTQGSSEPCRLQGAGMHAKLLQSSLTLCNPMDCCLLDSSVHGISQAKIPQWVAMLSSRGSSRPRD